MSKLLVQYQGKTFSLALPVEADTKHFTPTEVDEELRELGHRLGLEFLYSEEVRHE